MKKNTNEKLDTVGLIGLGLMGQGIASCLVANKMKVIGYSRSHKREDESRARISEALEQLAKRKIIPRSRMIGWEKRFTFVHALEGLAQCPFIIETVAEDITLKRSIYDRLESFLPKETVIASNTSSLPITFLQQGRRHPERFIGMHWAEPAEITRYLEIVR